MLSEPFKIIFRRFVNRLTESGLLIISVALGVGAFAAGGTLFVNVINENNQVLNSPSYKEIVISTREESDSMEVPVKEKLLNEDAILAQSDLTAAEMIPSISYSYIMNSTRLRMINEDFQEQANNFATPEQNNESSEDGGDTQVQPNNPQDRLDELLGDGFDSILSDNSIVLSDEDEISGYKVTSQFFDAWDITAAAGSLFSSVDYNQTNSLVILGSEFAKTLIEDDEDVSSLIGKRMLALQGYQTIVGVLEETDTSYDYQFFSPYSDNTSSGEFSQIRRLSQNTQLRFSVSDPEDLDTVSQTLEQWFTSEYGEGQIIVTNPRVEAEQTVDRNSGISILLLVLALSGLFISSVNISHILLSRTLRMKKHVGILMALGATKKNINLLFSLEALMIIVIGTVLGVLIAIPINSQMQSALELTISSNYMILISALASAVLIYCFTIIPIRRFDRIKPADAMRTQ
jgi:ABC-type antimicrobial peptide transport system permease subunit